MSGSGDGTSGNLPVQRNEKYVDAGVNQPTHPFKNEAGSPSPSGTQNYWFWMTCFFGTGLDLEAFLSEGGTILFAAEVDNTPMNYLGSSAHMDQCGSGDYCIYSMQNMTSPTSTPSQTQTQTLRAPQLDLSCQSFTNTTNFRIEISGTLAFDGTGLSSVPVRLSYSTDKGNSWNPLTLVSTDNSGNFSTLWNPSATGNYLINATYSGNSTYAQANAIINFAFMPSEQELPPEQQNVFSVSSNSTITMLSFNSASNELSFTVSGPTGTTGYGDVLIPKSLINDTSTLKVYVDGNPLTYVVESQEDSWLVSFTYHHSTHKVTISLGPPSASTAESQIGGSIISAITAAALAFAAVLLLLKKLDRNRHPHPPPRTIDNK
jgi:hypothetical protein